jgi:DNA-binding transcriptional MerR regulator
MLKIGDFSRLSRVSVRMLRYYDDAGLVKPEKIDEFTGYRYYSESQLPAMWKINTLKDMGFGVAAIREIMKCEDNPQEMEKLLVLHRAELQEEAEIIEGRLRSLDAAIERLKKGDEMKGRMTSFQRCMRSLPHGWMKTDIASMVPCLIFTM